MIKINKPNDIPDVLKANKDLWTRELINAIQKYNSYSKIPKEEKEGLLCHYRHKDIQEALFKCSHNKCSFCECIPSEGGNIEVEHFAPKSIYHNLTFEWDNLLPICRKCNEAKSNYDTVSEPIVNPCKQNPAEYFEYSLINMIPSDTTPNKEISERTIIVCNLNSTRLFRARADLLCHLSIYQQELLNWLREIQETTGSIKRRNKIIKLINSIDAIELLSKETEKYSGFCNNFLQKSCVYNEAKDIIEKFRRESVS